jgi:hypothetical protein
MQKVMKRAGLILFCLALPMFSGCAGYVGVSDGPNVTNLTQYANAKPWAVMQASDDRESEVAGRVGIGLLPKVKREDLSRVVTNHLIVTLNTEKKINVLKVNKGNAAQLAQDLAANGIAGIIEPKVKMIKISSIDLMIPIKPEMEMDLIFYDGEGKKIVERSFWAKNSEGVIPMTPGKEKEIVDSVVREMMRTISQDDQVQKILAGNP